MPQAFKGAYMSRAKKTSKIVEEAGVRVAGIKSIDQDLDLGNGLTVKNYEKEIEETAKALEDYNTILSMADEKLNLYNQKEKSLMAFHERMLLGVAVKFGKDSNEYEKAGGTKKSDRKRSTKPPEKKPT
jgi:tRNA(Phe) wybutosine-synthesizing methylase Tyw3